MKFRIYVHHEKFVIYTKKFFFYGKLWSWEALGTNSLYHFTIKEYSTLTAAIVACNTYAEAEVKKLEQPVLVKELEIKNE